MIESSLTPLLQMSPAMLHRGPFWSLAAYFACAVVSLQNILCVLLFAWRRTKKLFYLLYTPGCCALWSKMNNQPTCAEHPFFIWRKNPCKSFPCYMLKAFSRSRLRHPLQRIIYHQLNLNQTGILESPLWFRFWLPDSSLFGHFETSDQLKLILVPIW